MSRWALGIDFGGTAIKAAVISEGQGLVEDCRVPTNSSAGPEAIFSQLAELIGAMYHKGCATCDAANFAGVGLGAPGVVDVERGVLKYPPNLHGWGLVPLREELQQRLQQEHGLQVQIHLDNDANVAAFGESRYGAGQPFPNFLMVTLGTGVGGGIVLNRSIYRGSYGTAGEVGFMIVDVDSPHTHAGIHGTLEGMLGKKSIVAMACSMMHNAATTSTMGNYCNNDFSRLSPRHIEYAAREGDAVALAVWERVGHLLGSALASVTALMDIRKFVIGGGISGAGSLIFEPARQQLLHSTHPSMHEGLELVPAFLGNKAGMYGAASLCF
uniref:Glucokinase, putative n=1 Tax=Chlorobium chlorochromatii (strain CaD3) TaxID=340177 RepID=Q3AU48_CHLCH